MRGNVQRKVLAWGVCNSKASYDDDGRQQDERDTQHQSSISSSIYHPVPRKKYKRGMSHPLPNREHLRCGSRPLFSFHHVQRRVHDELIQVRRFVPCRCSPSAAAAAAAAVPNRAKIRLVERLVSSDYHKNRHGFCGAFGCTSSTNHAVG